MPDKEHPVPYQRQMVDIGDIYVGADGGHEIWRTPKGYSRYFAKDVDGDFEDVGARWYCKPPGLCPDSSEGGVFVDIAWAVFVAPVERAD